MSKKNSYVITKTAKQLQASIRRYAKIMGMSPAEAVLRANTMSMGKWRGTMIEVYLKQAIFLLDDDYPSSWDLSND